MALNLTSCTSIREPGFSQSECLDLARWLEVPDCVISRDPETCDECGAVILCERETLSPRQRDTIVAALRAYAK